MFSLHYFITKFDFYLFFSFRFPDVASHLDESNTDSAKTPDSDADEIKPSKIPSQTEYFNIFVTMASNPGNFMVCLNSAFSFIWLKKQYLNTFTNNTGSIS